MERVKKGTKLWEEYRALHQMHPDLFKWREDKQGNYIPEDPVWEDTVKAKEFYKNCSQPAEVCELEDALLLLIDTLDPRQREVIHCLFYECLTIAGTARRLRVSRVTVYSWMYRAFETIKSELGKWGEDGNEVKLFSCQERWGKHRRLVEAIQESIQEVEA